MIRHVGDHDARIVRARSGAHHETRLAEAATEGIGERLEADLGAEIAGDRLVVKRGVIGTVVQLGTITGQPQAPAGFGHRGLIDVADLAEGPRRDVGLVVVEEVPGAVEGFARGEHLGSTVIGFAGVGFAGLGHRLVAGHFFDPVAHLAAEDRPRQFGRRGEIGIRRTYRRLVGRRHLDLEAEALAAGDLGVEAAHEGGRLAEPIRAANKAHLHAVIAGAHVEPEAIGALPQAGDFFDLEPAFGHPADAHLSRGDRGRRTGGVDEGDFEGATTLGGKAGQGEEEQAEEGQSRNQGGSAVELRRR